MWPQYTCSVSACDLINPATLTPATQDPDNRNLISKHSHPLPFLETGAKNILGGEGGVSN